MNFKSILAIGAHPDDIELGCFGFLYKQQKIGSQINAYIVSPDSLSNGYLTETRIQESTNALSLISHINLIIEKTNNINFERYQKISDKIRDIVLKNNVDLVLVHDKNDTMQEHRLLHDIALTAVRRLPVNIILYKSPSSESFQTNFIVDIEKEYETKVLAIKKHITQKNKPYLSDQSIDIFNQTWAGKKIGFNKNEEFIVYRMVM